MKSLCLRFPSSDLVARTNDDVPAFPGKTLIIGLKLSGLTVGLEINFIDVLTN